MNESFLSALLGLILGFGWDVHVENQIVDILREHGERSRLHRQHHLEPLPLGPHRRPSPPRRRNASLGLPSHPLKSHRVLSLSRRSADLPGKEGICQTDGVTGERPKGPLDDLQKRLVEYYSPRIRYHAKTAMSIEKGKTGRPFFADVCGGIASGRLNNMHLFARALDQLSDDLDFYATMAANLTPTERQKVVNEMGFMDRPFQFASRFMLVAKRCPGFRKINILLLSGPLPRKVGSRLESGAGAGLNSLTC